MMEGGFPTDNPDGPGPMIRICVMPVESWEIRDTWRTLGLKGTGSHHVSLAERAGSGPREIASGRNGVRAIAVIPSRARNGLHRPKQAFPC
jgi:hypothetical protein